MTDKQLRLFLAVADRGSFSQAESVEYMSKQAMLRQIDNLEEEAGVKLFERTRHGITLTPAGKIFYDGAGEILKDYRLLLDRCRSLSSETEVLRVGQVEHQALLTRVTDAFAAKYPYVPIRKVIHPNHSGEYRVRNDIIDVGETFYSDRTPSEGLLYTPLEDLPYVAAVRKDHPLTEKDTVSLEEIAAYPTIVYEPMIKPEYLSSLTALFAALGKSGNLQVRHDVDNQVDAAFACCSTDNVLLTANCFVYFIPELACVPVEGGWFQEYGIICRKDPTSTVRRYVDLAVALFAAKPLAAEYLKKKKEK